MAINDNYTFHNKFAEDKDLNNKMLEQLSESFDGHSGSDVELYLKHELERSVVDLEYKGSEMLLVGKNSYGEEICSTKVVTTDPTYSVDCEFINISVGNTVYNNSFTLIQINKTDLINVNAKFKFVVTGNIAGSTYNETSPQTVTFNWYKTLDSKDVDSSLESYSYDIIPGEEVSVNITKLFEYAFTGKYLGITYNIGGTITKFFTSPITLKAISLNYVGSYLLRSNVISGFETVGVDESGYKFEYYLDNRTKQELNYSDTLTLSNDLTEGTHYLFVRVVNEDKTLVSNDLQINFIYQKESSDLQEAITLVTSVPSSVNNCDTSKLFSIVTTDKLQGNTRIVVLKSNVLSNIANINTIEEAVASNFVFKNIEFNLLNTENSITLDYNSYIEVNSLNLEEYIVVFIGANKLKFYNRNNVGTVTLLDYKTIKIINPKSGINHLIATSGSVLNFTQVNPGNAFTNLNEDLDDSNGLLTETENNTSLLIFKVSAGLKVFNSPVTLLNKSNISLNSGSFSIEMMIKTYDCNDMNDEIFYIGNIKVCPNYLFVYRDGESITSTTPTDIRNASRADFLKNKKLHIIITFNPNYKPSTYSTIYDALYEADGNNYTKNAKPYPCLKIYVNGTINRTIKLKSEDLQTDSFNWQIQPKNSNINFYIFRTYDKELSYTEIRLNYASSMLKLLDKESYYLLNDILYNEDDFTVSLLASKSNILNTISLGKCLNKFTSVSDPTKSYSNRRVLLLALPEGILPPYYGNRKDKLPRATLLVNYPNDKLHSGRLSNCKIKPQGSSAKKYTIHNPAYSEFDFVPEQEWANPNYEALDYYVMPYDDIHIKKLVGKVNFASSMLSHKQGATKLFHDGYINMCEKTMLNTDWMNGGRKAVLEDDFMYFYVNVPEEDLQTLTWDYFKDENGNYNFENCHFLGFQTWGSAKGDKATSGYDDNTPYYLMLEGADNANPAANFKVPWAAMQCWENPLSVNSAFKQYSGKTELGTPDYLTGILINDETIVYNPGTEKGNSTDKRADALDVDFGCKEASGYDEDSNPVFEFKEKVKVSVNRFAEFFNYIYKYDFSSLIFIPNNTTIKLTSSTAEDTSGNSYAETYNKLVFGDSCSVIDEQGNTISVNPGDIYRWEKEWHTDVQNAPRVSKWVPGGLFYINNSWETLNIYDICNEYTLAENNFFARYDNLKCKSGDNYKYFGYPIEHLLYDPEFGKDPVKIMAEAFKIIIAEYTDVDDVTYHQAFIRLVSGTDNRAKNTYFQIVGPIITDDSYEVTSENLTKDFKIHLYQDDLDTILKTDNNGQQVKPYYLLEPPFNKQTSRLWGDLHSGLFHNLDITYIDEIKNKLGDLLEFASGDSWADATHTKIYQYFLSVLQGIPSIAYNHHSEIYYESAETLWLDSEATDFYNLLKNSTKQENWKDFTNNQVANPLSLSHGSCYDAEVEYLNNRILFLSTYAGKGKTTTGISTLLSGSSAETQGKTYSILSDYTSFILYIYPTLSGLPINKQTSKLLYDSVIDLLAENKEDKTENLVYDVVIPNESISLDRTFTSSALTIAPTWENTDLYKTLYLKTAQGINGFFKFPNISTLISLYDSYSINIGSNTMLKAEEYFKSVEHLVIQNASIKCLGFDFTGCNRLKTLVLGSYDEFALEDVLDSTNTVTVAAGNGCTEFEQVILPNNNSLQTLVLPSCINTLNMGYYPNLTTIDLNSGISLTSLVIDGRNTEYIINNVLSYIATGPGTSLYITNIPEEGVWISESNCNLLANVEKVYINGTINIGENKTLSTISFNTKKSLVEKFGNIDSTTNSAIFKYTTKSITSVTTSATATILYSGIVPINLSVNGNNVLIENSKLKIKYQLLDSSGASVSDENIKINESTGYLTIAEDHEGVYKVRVTIWYGSTSTSKDTNLTVGFYAPQVGDFAYADGSFSPVFDSSLSLVGLVYAVNSLGSDSYNVYVISNATITGNPLGPSLETDGNTSSIRQAQYDMLGILTGNNQSQFYSDITRSNHTYTTGTIDTSISISSLENKVFALNEALNLRQYLEKINSYIEYLNDPTLNELGSLSGNTADYNEKIKYNAYYSYLYNLNTITINGLNFSKNSVGSFIYCLYPAIVNTLYYQPKQLSNKGLSYYLYGKWYVPTTNDLSLVMLHRIRAASSNDSESKNKWNSNTYVGNSLYSPKFNIDSFRLISFLKTSLGSLTAVECTDSGHSYSYFNDYYSGLGDPQWTYHTYYYGSECHRDMEKTIYPCCCVTISK